MATQEFYIRNADETEARGPFNHEQLVSLAEAGRVSPETLFYDATIEQWVAIQSNAELKQQLFPEKRKLAMKQKEIAQTINAPASEAASPISVGDMLAAAEGKTEDTKDKRHALEMQERCAKVSPYVVSATLLLSAVALVLPSLEALAGLDLAKLAAAPLTFLGVADLVLGLLMTLQVIGIYPIVRFRAALGLGLLGFIFWAQGDTHAMMAALAGSSGLFIATLSLTYAAMGSAIVLGVGGMAYLVFLTLF